MATDADRAKLIFLEETTFKTAASGTYQTLRHTGETFSQETDTSQSNELRSDRQIADVFRTNVRVSGDVNFELSYGTYDLLFEAVFQSTDWSTEVVVAGADTAVSAAASDNSINHTTGWDANPAVGDWLEIRGFSTAGNNGYAKVASVTGTKIVLEGIVLVDEAAGNAIDVDAGAAITNGTTQRSFTFEREYTDATNEFALFVGMTFGGFSLSVQAGNAITGTFTLLGGSESSETSSQDGAATAATTTSIMNAIDHVVKFLEGGTALDMLQFSIDMQNDLRERPIVGEVGPQSIGAGRCAVTGGLQIYFEDSTLADKYLNFTTTSLAIVMEDNDGNAYILDIPSVKLTQGPRTPGGTGSDIILDLSWSAFVDATETVTIRMVRFAA